MVHLPPSLPLHKSNKPLWFPIVRMYHQRRIKRSHMTPPGSLSLSLRISVKTRADHNICCFPLETHTVLQNDQKVPPHISLPAPLTSPLFFLKVNFQTSRLE